MKNGLVVDEYGNKYWYKDSQLHRDDGPAIEHKDGSMSWYYKGIFVGGKGTYAGMGATSSIVKTLLTRCRG